MRNSPQLANCMKEITEDLKGGNSTVWKMLR